MRKVQFWGLWCVFLYCQNLYAQDEKWNELEKERHYINTQIQKGEYLLNELKINANRLATHGDGEEFHHWEKYFYTFDVRKENAPVMLKAVIIKTEKDGTSIYREYMFDNTGNCIYYNEIKQNYKTALDEKESYYMEAGKPIRWLKNGTDLTFDTEKPEKITAKIVENAQKFQTKFSKQMKD